MSSRDILSVGSRCSVCPLVDFLPFTCPHCAQTFCSDHIRTHACPDTSTASTSAGPSTAAWSKQTRCPVQGCERVTIESVAGITADADGGTSSGQVADIAKEVRCPGCGGAFCVVHRQQAAHACSAPEDFNDRHEAFLLRRSHAQEVLARTFPDQAARSIPKPPPQRDVVRPPPSATTSGGRLGPSPDLPPTAVSSGTTSQTQTQVPAQTQSKTKSKAEKLYDMHLRKLRSLAKPLDSKQRDGDKRFFEWGTGDVENARKWADSGKWERGKLERSWVLQETPTGKVLDLLIAASRTSRPTSTSASDPAQTLSLICLSSPPDAPRSLALLDLSRPAREQIFEGGVVLLVRGWTD
ncbi:hypothetical protein JCM24511_05630 [Saitozyma sp. JCM 24511]|nr:hypothetical protein JCM24511_05630 [Saitozyma sp. JCM 24511]